MNSIYRFTARANCLLVFLILTACIFNQCQNCCSSVRPLITLQCIFLDNYFSQAFQTNNFTISTLNFFTISPFKLSFSTLVPLWILVQSLPILATLLTISKIYSNFTTFHVCSPFHHSRWFEQVLLTVYGGLLFNSSATRKCPLDLGPFSFQKVRPWVVSSATAVLNSFQKWSHSFRSNSCLEQGFSDFLANYLTHLLLIDNVPALSTCYVRCHKLNTQVHRLMNFVFCFDRPNDDRYGFGLGLLPTSWTVSN